MTNVEQSMAQAIRAIEGFLQHDSADVTESTVDCLRRLAHQIEGARSSRDLHLHASPQALDHFDLCLRYRESLERLRAQLSKMEQGLQRERERVTEDQARIAKTLAWHSSFCRTKP